MNDNDARVLVTGGTGFIAQHCILALLSRGYRVRTTVRSLAREAEVREHLKAGGAEPGDRLSFVTADLSADDGWAEAIAGCVYVMHGASPTPTGHQTSEDDWIRPAVDGNLRVLRAARDAGVRRVVLTSAFGAICAGHGPMTRPFNETDWSDLTKTNVWPLLLVAALAFFGSWAAGTNNFWLSYSLLVPTIRNVSGCARWVQFFSVSKQTRGGVEVPSPGKHR